MVLLDSVFHQGYLFESASYAGEQAWAGSEKHLFIGIWKPRSLLTSLMCAVGKWKLYF